ncbi:unnamed protein product [Mytilus coruscus]|uniref:Uncharacterized protein n=1 Tax=Mytilus coruscus TaxID=42192 RepID=A0A6J8CJA9_MYTCO|nr:unnamed protein product [Mytilus coruscus]
MCKHKTFILKDKWSLMYNDTPNSKYPRYRRESKPSPPERDFYKKQNIMSSPGLLEHHNINPNNPGTPQQGMSFNPQIHPSHSNSLYGQPNSQGPSQPLALQSCDIANIVTQLKFALNEEIQNTIKSLFTIELDAILKNALEPYAQEVQVLKQENTKLKADIDSLEQYGRRELVRFSGIDETTGENTTEIVSNIVKSIDPELADGDIIRSHRVGNPNRKDRFGNKLPGPRQAYP